MIAILKESNKIISFIFADDTDLGEDHLHRA